MDILPQLLVNSLITGSIYALAALGLALSFGILGILNFSHGHMMMVGAYVFLWLSHPDHLHLGYSAAALGLLVFMPVFAWLCMWCAIHPFRKHGGSLTLVSTLALSYVLEAVVSMTFGVNTQSLAAEWLPESFELFGAYITPLQVGILGAAVALFFIAGIFFYGTQLGLSLRAMRENDLAAAALGLNTERLQFSVFAASAILAGIAGVLIGLETTLQPTMGTAYTVKSFAAVIVGGVGNIWGAVLGSYLLGFIENFGIGLTFFGYQIPSGYKDAFAYLLIAGLLLFRPEGLLRAKLRKV